MAIRYDIFTCAQKLTIWPAYSLAHGTETENNEKTTNKNRVAQKKRSGQKSVKAVREEKERGRKGRVKG